MLARVYELAIMVEAKRKIQTYRFRDADQRVPVVVQPVA
jgi:hypothetical protein